MGEATSGAREVPIAYNEGYWAQERMSGAKEGVYEQVQNGMDLQKLGIQELR